MPRGKRKRKRKHGKDRPVVYNEGLNQRRHAPMVDSGTTIPLSHAPEDVQEVFKSVDKIDEESERAAGVSGEKFAGSEFIDGEGEALDDINPESKPGDQEAFEKALNDPVIKPAKLPLPVKREGSTYPAPVTEVPDTFDNSWSAPATAPVEESVIEEAAIAELVPPQKYSGEEGIRKHFTWIVTETNIKSVRGTNGQLTAALTVKAMLSVCQYRQYTPDPTNAPPEPFLTVEHMFPEPVEMLIPLWLFSPDKQRRPDTISMAEASSALVTMFASMPMEIIRPAPLPRSLAAMPPWMRKEIAAKGPMRR